MDKAYEEDVIKREVDKEWKMGKNVTKWRRQKRKKASRKFKKNKKKLGWQKKMKKIYVRNVKIKWKVLNI